MHYVTQAHYIDGYKIEVSFDDKKHGVIDLSTTINHDHRPIFRELANIEKFKKFRVEADTIVWENGLDLAPSYLYQKLSETKDNNEFFQKMNG